MSNQTISLSPSSTASVRPVNVLNWFEIPVTDLARATRLYEAMLDTRLERFDGGGVPHAMITNADHSCVSGALVADPRRKPVQGAGSLLYLNARDGLQRCLSRAVEAGAKVVMPVTSIGEHGSICVIEDLDGNHVGLHEELAGTTPGVAQ